MVTLEDARTTAAAIVKTLRPLSIVLFGSVATRGSGTDLDLLIVTDEKGGVGDDNLLHECLKPFFEKFEIDSFIVPQSLLKEHYAEGSPFLRLIEREGRLLYMRDIVAEWLRQAGEDSKAANYLFEGGYFRSSCFHAQQAIEKAIKACLLKEGWELEKVHSIRRLVSISRSFNLHLKISDDEITFIDGIYRGRYPAEAGLLPLGEPSKEEAERAVGLAKRVLNVTRSDRC